MANTEDETETVCRVCGFDGEAFWEGGWPNEAAICPCCGNEPDVGDASVMSLRNYRGYSVGHGAPWLSPSEERKRQGWDLLTQREDIPLQWR
ncbi:MAG TPA: hypothetical protein VN520_12635 [Streptomyces sp.]|uniref:hypothetical protein n=1 Tax=Streptomyces sp. TaxID=1931 RepID=UPI002C53620C|nr:hypothetical protein [Streptomyces sp.]HWU07205.1 hypothetical protein [Streptomyces sp.]